MRDAELAQRADPANPDAHPALGGRFIAEGDLVVRRLIRSRFATESVLLAKNRVAGLADELARLPAGTPVFVAEQQVLNGVVGFNMHRGVLAIGRRPREPEAGAGAVERFLAGRQGPIVVLEDLVNHDNLGAIFRNAAGLGGPGCAVLLSPRCADPLYRKSLRVSMGHVLTVPFMRMPDWQEGLAGLRAGGFRILALTPGARAVDLETVCRGGPPERVALLVGSEGPGLSAEALAAADLGVRIDMPPAADGEVIDSLNVAMATGIALYRLRPPTPHPPTPGRL